MPSDRFALGARFPVHDDRGTLNSRWHNTWAGDETRENSSTAPCFLGGQEKRADRSEWWWWPRGLRSAESSASSKRDGLITGRSWGLAATTA